MRHQAAAEASTGRAVAPNRPLPRGRHGLPREAVTESQRRRLIDSMVGAVAERGFGDTRVVDVVEVAGVSRATFYDLFDDLEDCFLATYDLEVRAAGPNALVRRDAVLRQLAELVDAGRAQSKAGPPRMTSVAVIGGIQEVLYGEVIHGAIARLPARLPELVYWITQPYLGNEAAAAESHRARQAVRGSA